MELERLEVNPKISRSKNLDASYTRFTMLLNELSNRSLPNEIISAINEDVRQINLIAPSDSKKLRKQILKSRARVLDLIEKKLKLVPKGYYRNLWLGVGMAAFGLPIGSLFGVSMGNIGLLGVGLPIGMIIGMGIGTRMDKKAFEEGRQLAL